MGFHYLASRISILALAAGLLAAAAPASPAQSPPSPEPEVFPRSAPRGLDDPRGVYLHPGDDGTTDATAGRLTLQHLVGGGVREVSLRHRFRSGDRFRFWVSANRAGWLYVLHRAGDGPASVLWPPSPGSPGDPGPGANRLLPREPTAVPPPPAFFVFDQEVGTEHFYVAIVSEPRPPSLSVLDEAPASPPAHPAASPKTPVRPEPQAVAPPDLPPSTSPRIVQFSVRASTGGEPGPSRAVVLDPIRGGTDPATYFSLLPEDVGGALVFEFQLRHED